VFQEAIPPYAPGSSEALLQVPPLPLNTSSPATAYYTLKQWNSNYEFQYNRSVYNFRIRSSYSN
jgi:hypothetical protein